MTKNNITIMKKNFTQTDLDNIDPRIKEAMEGWKIIEQYKGKEVFIPGTWNSEIYPYKYFEVYKTDSDNNPGEAENEIQLYLSCGWRGYDDEVVIVLMIQGYSVLGNEEKISAEIYKFGGADMGVYRKGKLITNFQKRSWWWTEPVDKVWIDDVLNA